MHSELILSFAKKVLNAILDNLALWRATNRQIAINWRYWGPIFAKSPYWCFLEIFGPKIAKKKYVSKCLKLPNSSRNAIKFF